MHIPIRPKVISVAPKLTIDWGGREHHGEGRLEFSTAALNL